MANDSVTCPACGKAYRWTERLAGRKVKCKGCESVFRMLASASDGTELVRAASDRAADEPAPPPSPPANTPQPSQGPADGGSYELELDEPASDSPPAPGAPPVDDGQPTMQCPSCNATIKASAVICIQCGFNLKKGKRLQTQVKAAAATQTPAEAAPKDAPQAPAKAATPVVGGTALKANLERAAAKRALDNEMAQDTEREHYRKDRTIPLILIGVGAFLIFFNALVLVPQVQNPFGSTTVISLIVLIIVALVWAVVKLIVQLPLLLFGLFFMARLFGSSYGTLSVAMLKLLALATFLNGIDFCVNSGLDILTGGWGGIGVMMVRFSIAFGVFWALCSSLFEMELVETFVLFCIMIIVPFMVMALIGFVILSSLGIF